MIWKLRIAVLRQVFFHKHWSFYLEWGSTGILLLGVALTAFNIYPTNVYISFVGNALWLAVGLMWRKYSLAVVEAVICLLYIAGMLKAAGWM